MAAGEGATRRESHQGEARRRGWAVWPRGSLGEWPLSGAVAGTSARSFGRALLAGPNTPA